MAAGMKDPSTWNKRTRTSHIESLRPILEKLITLAIHMCDFQRRVYHTRSGGDTERYKVGGKERQQNRQEHFLLGGGDQ